MLKLTKPELNRVFKNVGSEERLREILHEFYEIMSHDVLIGFFFEGKDLGKIADNQTEFLLRAMGERPTYSGKAPAEAHSAISPILPGHFDRRLRILEDLLRKHGLDDQDIRTWIAFENAFRDGIVSDEKR